MLFIVKIQVFNVHRSSYKFLLLIPYLVSGEDIQASNLDWMRDLIDVPVSSRARVITGEVFLLVCLGIIYQHGLLLVVKLLLTLIFSFTLSILTHYAVDSSLS
jgi:hypothetical protein